jgi:uncharacterized glyoxalase superfamily protein PhnB
MIMVMDNPDEVVKRALDAGARQIWPVADQDYGWRVGAIIGRLASR